MSRKTRQNNAPPAVPDELIKLVSAEQLAAAWSIPVSSVRRWARENRIPGIRIGGVWRFDVAALNALIRPGK
jgi:excisionase family DNA binding protein